MTAVEFPRRHAPLIQQLAIRALDVRKLGTTPQGLARAVLASFFELCIQVGLDRVIADLERAFEPYEITDAQALADHPQLSAALAAMLGAIDFDDGRPRNAKVSELASSVVTALELALTDVTDRTITLDDSIRVQAIAAIASVVDVELAVPDIREAIIANARERCEPEHLAAFNRTDAQLDEQGMRLLKQPKIPLHVAHAVQLALATARTAIIDRVARAALDRAQAVIATADAEAGARIDQPVSHRLTPRDVAILRVCDVNVLKVSRVVTPTLLAGLSDGAQLAWRAPQRTVHAYSARSSFAVGDTIEHPTFGIGTVISSQLQRVEVEFSDGRRTLAHAGAAKPLT